MMIVMGACQMGSYLTEECDRFLFQLLWVANVAVHNGLKRQTVLGIELFLQRLCLDGKFAAHGILNISDMAIHIIQAYNLLSRI